jgi:mannose-6-phosphate isomerase-like protein (cupin superfamily)
MTIVNAWGWRIEVKRPVALLVLGLCTALSALTWAQTTGDCIDYYFGDWHSSPRRTTRGSLQQQDILVRGDAMNPTQKGGVLRYLNSYTHATLAPHAKTRAERLEGQQEIYFVDSGRGTATAGGQTADLYRNITVLMPANLEFTITNTGDELLSMYVINEPTPPGFRPNANMLVRDENKLPISSSDGMWSHVVKTIYVTADGLGTLQTVLTVALDPLTIGKPHPFPGEDSNEIEEVWTALDGTSLAFVGNQLRRQTPGTALYHVPDNKTPHTNINQSAETQVRFLYFARYRGHETRR